ncbi:hypothetical protein [Nocardia sp. NBC_00511]|uniref:hypothetical protein n=1 Tax=Nocardia sp. NBC_00511 TaxID=2903591 RepID=UPI0030DEE948
MNLLDCEVDPGPLEFASARLAWRLHLYCDRVACRVRRRARLSLEQFAGAARDVERRW